MDNTLLAFTIWSTMHGLCTLKSSGHLGHVGVARANQWNLDELTAMAYETFVAMLERMKT